MKKLIVTIVLSGLISSSLLGQFFIIPIILPYGNYAPIYQCPTSSSLAKEYIQKGIEKHETNIEASIVYFKAAIAEDSLFCDAYYNLIICLNNSQNYDSALKYVDLAIKINPSKYWVRKTKGLLFMIKNDYESSSKYFAKQIEIQPEDPLWFYYHAISLIELEKFDSARKSAISMEYLLTKADNIYAHSLGLYLQARIKYKQQDFNKALIVFNQIYDDYKNEALYNYYYGVCNLKQDIPNEKKARKHIKKALRKGYTKFDPEIIKNLKI
ncbi:MAG: hypothetical protein HQ521_14760 [Bacteroidetes bacterium]|nr:hypothetical protein [Bacteroidota bacterium]